MRPLLAPAFCDYLPLDRCLRFFPVLVHAARLSPPAMGRRIAGCGRASLERLSICALVRIRFCLVTIVCGGSRGVETIP